MLLRLINALVLRISTLHVHVRNDVLQALVYHDVGLEGSCV
jgi:hypothetical protein